MAFVPVLCIFSLVYQAIFCLPDLFDLCFTSVTALQLNCTATIFHPCCFVLFIGYTFQSSHLISYYLPVKTPVQLLMWQYNSHNFPGSWEHNFLFSSWELPWFSEPEKNLRVRLPCTMTNRAEMLEQTMTSWAPEQHSPTSEYISFAERQGLSAWGYRHAKSNALFLGSELVSPCDSTAHVIHVCSR